VALRAAHESFLATTPRRRRGDVDVAIAVAAKLNDGQTLEDARAWLNSRERLAVLNDRALIAMLARLPNAAAQVNAA
jgi:membrane glycosyltransferase